MATLITVLVLILIISVLVLVHELGHFFAAKLAGVRVEEFGMGLPPKIFGKKFGETTYSLNWLPFGGFVRLSGEDLEEDPAAKEDPRSFRNKSRLARSGILVAGVLMNVLLAVLLYSFVFMLTSHKSLTLPMFFEHKFRYGNVEKLSTVVTGVQEGSLAEEAGIDRGEAVLEIGSVQVYSVSDVRDLLQGRANKETSILLMDVTGVERELRTVHVVPQENEEGKVVLGVLLNDAFRLDYSGDRRFAPFKHAWNMLSYSVGTTGNLIQLSIENRDISPVSDSVAGPVGISQAVAGILDYRGRDMWIGLLDLTALLSISLAFLNILPFPALDGGRLVFVGIEAAVGKKATQRIEYSAHRWGMLVLLLLIILVTVKDIRNLF